MKKKQHNGKRSSTTDPTAEPEETGEPKQTDDTKELKETQETQASAPQDKDLEATAEDLEFDEDMVEQVRVQTSLLEGRELSREETIEMLKRVMRQHSLAPERRRDYVLRYLKEKEEENPP